MDVNRIWILIGKKLTKEASPTELAELESFMADRIDNTYRLRELEEMWLAGKKMPETIDSELDAKWARFKNKLPENRLAEEPEAANTLRPLYKLRWLSAACLLATAVAGMWFYIKKDTKTAGIATSVKSPRGSISEVKLPDGTKVWLNAGSVLTYKSGYGEKLREVSLTGEAYFDVVKDSSHPFIVLTSSLQLKVLGTAFNVRSFKNDNTSEASLIRGSVEVTLLSSPDKKIILKPSEKITIRNRANPVKTSVKSLRSQLSANEQPLIALSNVHFQEEETLPTETQWMEKKLAFTSERFDDLAYSMERYYNVSIRFKDEGMKALIFSGSFKEESIDAVMKALQVTGGFQFKTKGNVITIYK